jgi:pyrrolidone-carboxylate peptidase
MKLWRSLLMSAPGTGEVRLFIDESSHGCKPESREETWRRAERGPKGVDGGRPATGPRVLVYGFERYGRYRYNVTERLARQLGAGGRLLTVVLPVEFEERNFVRLLRRRPQAILGLGQCARGRRLRLELEAHNRMRDVGERRPRKIEPAGPRSVSTTLRIEPKRWLERSRNAGEYVCNYSMYVLLRRLGRGKERVPFAFIHVPHRYPLRRALARVEEIIGEVAQALTASPGRRTRGGSGR